MKYTRGGRTESQSESVKADVCDTATRGKGRSRLIRDLKTYIPVKIPSSTGERRSVSLCGIIVGGTIDVIPNNVERK